MTATQDHVATASKDVTEGVKLCCGGRGCKSERPWCCERNSRKWPGSGTEVFGEAHMGMSWVHEGLSLEVQGLHKFWDMAYCGLTRSLSHSLSFPDKCGHYHELIQLVLVEPRAVLVGNKNPGNVEDWTRPLSWSIRALTIVWQRLCLIKMLFFS